MGERRRLLVPINELPRPKTCFSCAHRVGLSEPSCRSPKNVVTHFDIIEGMPVRKFEACVDARLHGCGRDAAWWEPWRSRELEEALGNKEPTAQPARPKGKTKSSLEDLM